MNLKYIFGLHYSNLKLKAFMHFLASIVGKSIDLIFVFLKALSPINISLEPSANLTDDNFLQLYNA